MNANVLGTTDNAPFGIGVNTRRALRFESYAQSPSIVRGFGGNLVSLGAEPPRGSTSRRRGGTIGGGGDADSPYTAGPYSTVGTPRSAGGGETPQPVTTHLLAADSAAPLERTQRAWRPVPEARHPSSPIAPSTGLPTGATNSSLRDPATGPRRPSEAPKAKLRSRHSGD